MTMPDRDQRAAFLDFSHQLAGAAGAAALPLFRNCDDVEDKPGKSGFDPVTQADRDAEQAMRQMISRTYPAHNIKGEEFGFEDKGSDFTWVLDPIDGTRSFIIGMPVWGTIIGLVWRGQAIAGAMSQPYNREIFSGDGTRASLTSPDGVRALKTRPCEKLSDAVLVTTDPRLFELEDERAAYLRIENRVRMSRYGGDCYFYAMLAAGQIDLIVETGLADYDIAGLIPIVEGAGGVITNWEGGNMAGGGRIIAAGSKTLHEQALALAQAV